MLAVETPWLEGQISDLLLRGIRLRRVVHSLKDSLPDEELTALPRLGEVEATLFRWLAFVKTHPLSSPELAELIARAGDLARQQRSSRRELLSHLDSALMTKLLRRENRSTLRPEVVELELRRRVRATGLDPSYLHVLGTTLPTPDSVDLSARTWRGWRTDQDERELPPHLDLRTHIQSLPEVWLVAVARGLGLTAGPLPALYARVENHLCTPEGMSDVIRHLPVESRRILVDLLRRGGVWRYDLVTLHFGPDDEDCWFWDREPPHTPLERARRTGLLAVGMSPGPRPHRLVMVPVDIRDTLARALDVAPPPLPRSELWR